MGPTEISHWKENRSIRDLHGKLFAGTHATAVSLVFLIPNSRRAVSLELPTHTITKIRRVAASIPESSTRTANMAAAQIQETVAQWLEQASAFIRTLQYVSATG